MKRQITCIVCPRGCIMTADCGGDGQITVTGNACPRGQQHAVNECLHPTRTLTSIVRVSNREDTMVSVKTTQPIPKGEMARAMERIRSASVQAPVAIGDVILYDVCGADIVATKSVK